MVRSEIPIELQTAFKARPLNANKYSVGTVTIVGGSGHYMHAPVISALGSRAAGAGLIRLVVPDASRIAAGMMVPEATFTKLAVTCIAPKSDVTIIGMGLGTGVNVEVIVSRLLSGSKGRFVLDADALAILAGWYGKNDGYDPVEGQELVLTPHEGEAAKLLGWDKSRISADRLSAARAIAERYGATVALKGVNTLVVSADGNRVYENHTGNPFMALGGMGDLLAGIIGARWAYLKDDPFLATASSVWLHGYASDRLIAEMGDPSIVNTATKLGAIRAELDR